MTDIDQLILSTSLGLGSKVTRNRIVAAPMCVMLANTDGSVSEDVISHYKARARGGAGIVIVEITFTDDQGSRAFHTQLGAHNDRMIPGLNRLSEAIKIEGAIAGIQLGHCGAQRVISEPPVVAPSPIPWMKGKRTPHELTLDEVEQVIEDFIDAAGRASDAGFDLIELHGAHGYLINAFLSPPLNQRNDCYGGSAENRLRMVRELTQRVRDRIASDCLLSMRINGDDQLDGALEINDYIGIAKELSEAGVDVFHVSAGTYRVMEQRITPMYLPEAPFVKYAEQFKQHLDVPIIASGSIHSIETCESVVRNGMADLVAWARPLFADPELPRKIFERNEAAIIPCIRCNTCVAREQGGARGHCAVNPIAGRETEQLEKSENPQTILVVGAGPAGIQLSLSARSRGHKVLLVEKEKHLGGQIALAETFSFKKSFTRLLEYYSEALASAGVEVYLDSNIDETLAKFGDCIDVVVFATGNKIPVPDRFVALPTISSSVLDGLLHLGTLGSKVAIVGANLLGTEAAWHLAKHGREVSLVERSNRFADDVNLINQIVFPNVLSEAGVSVLMETEGLMATSRGLKVQYRNSEREIVVDNILISFGAAPIGVSDQLQELCKNWGAGIHVIQQQHKKYPLYWATHSAHQLARVL